MVKTPFPVAHFGVAGRNMQRDSVLRLHTSPCIVSAEAGKFYAVVVLSVK